MKATCTLTVNGTTPNCFYFPHYHRVCLYFFNRFSPYKMLLVPGARTSSRTSMNICRSLLLPLRGNSRSGEMFMINKLLIMMIFTDTYIIETLLAINFIKILLKIILVEAICITYNVTFCIDRRGIHESCTARFVVCRQWRMYRRLAS